jgi:hypothetical protein
LRTGGLADRIKLAVAASLDNHNLLPDRARCVV